jgi:hypothetical protein
MIDLKKILSEKYVGMSICDIEYIEEMEFFLNGMHTKDSLVLVTSLSLEVELTGVFIGSLLSFNPELIKWVSATKSPEMFNITNRTLGATDIDISDGGEGITDIITAIEIQPKFKSINTGDDI